MIFSLRCHDKRYDFQVTEEELWGRHERPERILELHARQGERKLGDACPAIRPIPFGEVADSPYEVIEYRLPNGRTERRMAQRLRPNSQAKDIAIENQHLSTIANNQREIEKLKQEAARLKAEVDRLNVRQHMPAQEGVRRLILT